MAARKPPKPCPHCATTDGLMAEIERLNQEINRRILDVGPRCHCHVGGPDERNQRLLESKAEVAKLLQERTKERDEAVNALRAIEASKARTRKQGGQARQRPARDYSAPSVQRVQW